MMRPPLRSIGALACAAAFASTGAASSAADDRPTARAAAVRDCHVYAYYPNVLISSAPNMTCRAAARDMRRYRDPIYRRFWTPGGFLCVRVSGSAHGGQWRCVNNARAYRFEFGD
jgi:hypothetical protein